MQTMLQTSLPGTELNQKPSCVFDGAHHGSNHSRCRQSGEGGGKDAVSRGSHKSERPPSQDGCCASMLLACLSCECGSLAAALLQLCCSCLWACCGRCCEGCERCCEALQDTPAEDLHCPMHCYDNCHAVMLEPCCEPVQCLDICMECFKICHYG
ncbi:hypothetical protein ACEWY4_010641 [Coilia grayii]|uniref:MyoD family inhibitor domain-containing protein n=1 Tax=Coilia grayii TaxID=363190 RepID=A0ABD1K2G7_9TELE